MIWPPQIRLLSVPSIVFFTLFFWNAVVYGIFSRILPVKGAERKKFLYFALTSFFLASYTFGSIMLYSAPGYEAAYFWNKWQLSSVVPVCSFFILFSSSQLGILSPYWTRVVPLVTLVFLPFVFIDGLFVLPNPSPKVMGFSFYHTRIYEGQLGVLGIPFFVWVLANIFVLARKWGQTFRGRWPERVLLVGFVIFLLAVINDILVVTEVYRFFYILELGFAAFILAMSFGLFHDYLEKSRQVQALNEEMRLLMSTISHDFNSPLISIEGFSQRLRDSLSEPQGQLDHFMERIQVNTQHLRDLVSDLADLLKIGRVSEDCCWVDPRSVLRQVLGILDTARINPHPRIQLPEECPRVWASEKRLKQIFLNLFQNSLKYSPPERVWIRLAWEERPGGILFSLEDHGPGIPAALREKVFTPFFRELRQQPGSGLGLAIVKKCVENLGGRIWVDPEGGVGARFCFLSPNKMGSGV